jgi:hypothetical protein
VLRVLVIGEPSNLAGSIASDLARDTAVQVLWLAQPESADNVHPVHGDGSVVFLVEECSYQHASRTADHLLWNGGCLHVIRIAPQKSPESSGTRA